MLNQKRTKENSLWIFNPLDEIKEREEELYVTTRKNEKSRHD